ncbi:hypothetical protein [Nicoliella lavandulae]|uniref:Uncharacterized protein n=1 Tax=Nicoliella lavandulae TaxID=3082954 RepID=A0ABU8SLV4_9LACO
MDALSEARAASDKLVLIQIHLDPEDGPAQLVKTGKIIDANNNK